MESTGKKPLPHCKALLVCQKVTESQLTGFITLHNLIECFRLSSFPRASTPFAIFLQVYDGIDRYRLAFEINALDDDTSVASATVADLDFPERLAKIDVVFPVDFVLLPRPGRYEIVVMVDGEELARQYFDAEIELEQE